MQTMELTKLPQSRLFSCTCVENKDELDERFERCYQTLQQLTNGLSETEAHDALNNAVLKEKTHEEVSLGLLVTILTDPKLAAKSYRDLTLISRDGLALVLGHLSQLILERYLRLQDVARSQLLWLVREMMRNSLPNVDTLCMHLMRHAAGGDISPRNVFLIEKLLDMYQENRAWLDKFPILIASIVYTYLRLIEDHNAPALAPLRQKEVTFMCSLMRERFVDCMPIGRDLVRLLQNVARIPEIEALWKDMLMNPKSLGPGFGGVLQLLQTRTSRRFLQSRLTPDMERKLVFLTSQVRFGNHKRYQDWFQRQYLATAESQTLRCDMIRFIVGVIHPTNELLCSDIIPRWAVIGWLLTTCTSSVAAVNAKLALFYDWLFYDAERDNIMNIEPAILVMHNSMRSYPAVTAALLDFLCRILNNFYPPFSDKVRAGVHTSFRQILEKRVLPALQPLFDSPKLDRELRTNVRECFKEFCVGNNVNSELKDPAGVDPDMLAPVGEDHGANVMANHLNNSRLQPDPIQNHTNNTMNSNKFTIDMDEPAFSDEDDEPPLVINPPMDSDDEAERDAPVDEDDDDIPLAKVRLKEKVPLASTGSGDFPSSQVNSISNVLEGDVRIAVEKLNGEGDNECKCQAMEDIVQLILDQDFDSEVLTGLASSLCFILRDVLENHNLFPLVLNDELLSDSISTPLFVMFRNLYQLCREEDRRRMPLITIIAEMYMIQPTIGYFILYFLKVWTDDEVKRQGEQPKLNVIKANVYKDFCQGAEQRLDVCLLKDLELCSRQVLRMFIYLVPDVYRDFREQALNNPDLLFIIARVIDGDQLRDFVALILQGKLVMFKNESIDTCLVRTLTWETFEQYVVWQCLAAHDVPIYQLLTILPNLKYADHSEPCMALLLMLKHEKPNSELIQTLFARDTCSNPNDVFVLSALKYWSQEHTDILGELISNLLSTRCPATSPNKRKRTVSKNPSNASLPNAVQSNALTNCTLSIELVLNHLDQLRRCCSGLVLYSLENMQKALLQAQNYCSESQKKRFGDLFALAEEEEMLPSSTKPRSSRGRKPVTVRTATPVVAAKRPNAARGTEANDTSDASSEDDFAAKKQAKKRKKVVSDSD